MTQDSNKKFYSQKIILIATYLGGPIATGILMRKNFNVIGKKKEANYALFLGFFTMILVLVGLYFMPDNIAEKIPNVMFPALYTGAAYFILEKVQGKELTEHKLNGGGFLFRMESFWDFRRLLCINRCLSFFGG